MVINKEDKMSSVSDEAARKMLDEAVRVEKILDVVLREMCAYGDAYRLDWSDFDGRDLRRQLHHLAEWAKEKKSSGDRNVDYNAGTLFLEGTLKNRR